MMQIHSGAGQMMRSVESSTKPIKVLIIERHPAVREALCKRLSATPQLEIIEAAPDVAGALAWIGPHHEPDVIVLGLQNGTELDLLETVQEVRRLVRHPAAVVVLAPYADEVERVLLQTAGVKSYLLKQINSQQLIREIQKVAADSAGN